MEGEGKSIWRLRSHMRMRRFNHTAVGLWAFGIVPLYAMEGRYRQAEETNIEYQITLYANFYVSSSFWEEVA